VSARVLSILASFLLTIAVARLLGAEAAGSFFLAFTTLAVIATFGRFGTDNLALKICGGQPSRVRVELGYSAVIAAAASLIGIGLAFAALTVIGYALPGLDMALMPLILSAALPQAFAVIAGSVLRGRGRLGLGITAELGSIPTITILLMLTYGALGALSLATALLSLVVASWITAVWAVIAVVSTLHQQDDRAGESAGTGFVAFTADRVGQLASMMGTSLLFYLLTWSPLYALSISSSLANVSYYTAAARFANLVALVPSIQVAYLSPAFARLFQRKEVNQLNALAQRAVRQAAAFLLVPVLVLALASSWIVHTLYGPSFGPAAIPLAILAIGVYLVALAGQVNQLMLLCDLESHALVQNVILIVLWSTVGLWVTGQFGAVGVAFFGAGTSILYAAAAAWLLTTKRGVRPHLRINWNRRVRIARSKNRTIVACNPWHKGGSRGQ
jgi:O-antigen/teichoic acid export membrane protein